MAFKYSNVSQNSTTDPKYENSFLQQILINRYHTLARFALMHLVGTAISSWFTTIINEAIDDYVHKIKALNGSYREEDVIFREAVEHQMYCLDKSIINKNSMDAIPYLYPFTIEYNIILASIWYMIWTNIGEKHTIPFITITQFCF